MLIKNGGSTPDWILWFGGQGVAHEYFFVIVSWLQNDYTISNQVSMPWHILNCNLGQDPTFSILAQGEASHLGWHVSLGDQARNHRHKIDLGRASRASFNEFHLSNWRPPPIENSFCLGKVLIWADDLKDFKMTTLQAQHSMLWWKTPRFCLWTKCKIISQINLANLPRPGSQRTMLASVGSELTLQAENWPGLKHETDIKWNAQLNPMHSTYTNSISF